MEDSILQNFDLNTNLNLLAGEYNLFFNTNLECCEGNPSFKQKSVTKLIKIIRNPKTKRFTFRQQHCSSFIQRPLDYIFISSSFQEPTVNTKLLLTFLSDHSPGFSSYNEMKNVLFGSLALKRNSVFRKDKQSLN